MAMAQDLNPRFRWPVAVEHPIAASADRVWTAISAAGNLKICHPFCERNPVEVWPGPESRDSIHYLSGLVYERRFFRWIEGVGYDLEIGPHGGRTSFVSWRIVPGPDHGCRLGITVYPHVLQRMPVAIRWLPHIARVRPMLTHYLLSVVQGFEWFVTRNEPVPRTQFGSHPWFSIPKGG